MSRLRAVVAVLAVFTAGAAFAQDVTVTPDRAAHVGDDFRQAIVLPGAGHGFRGVDAELATTAMVDRFTQHLAR